MKVKSMYPKIVSDNPEKTMAFYAALGFTKKHDLTTVRGGHVYIIANGDLEIELVESLDDGPFQCSAGFRGFRMNVDDIDVAVESIKQNGGTIISGPFDDTTSKFYLVKDVDGINISIMQHIKK